MIEVREYVDAHERSPFRDWLLGLDSFTQTRIATTVLRMEQGNLSTAKGIGSGLLEMRLDFGPGWRVYFGKDGDRLVILLGGGSKRRQQSDIATAHALWADYKRRKREKK